MLRRIRKQILHSLFFRPDLIIGRKNFIFKFKIRGFTDGEEKRNKKN